MSTDTPNMILLVMDSVRRDHCSVYGYEADTNPGLKNRPLTTFENAYANAPYTPASAPSYFESRLPLVDGHVSLTKTTSSLPNQFTKSSYTTAAVFNNVQLKRFEYPAQFDKHRDLTASASTMDENSEGLVGQVVNSSKKTMSNLFDSLPISDNQEKRIMYFLQSQLLQRQGVVQPHPSDQAVIEAAIKFTQELPEPYFLYIHLMGTHHPYEFTQEEFESISKTSFDSKLYAQALHKALQHGNKGSWLPEMSEEERECLTNAYDASIRHVDRLVTRLLDTLTEETATFITADHGEELWDRGHFGHAARQSKPRKATLFDEMLNVPLLVHGIDAGRIKTPVSLLDLLPTFLDFADVKIPDTLHGESLKPLLMDEDGKPDPSRPIIGHATSPGDPEAYMEQENSYALATIRQNGWKYIWNEAYPDKLFNVELDPKEQENVVDEHPERAGELREILLQTMALETTNIEGSMNDAVKEELKALGYL